MSLVRLGRGLRYSGPFADCAIISIPKSDQVPRQEYRETMKKLTVICVVYGFTAFGIAAAITPVKAGEPYAEVTHITCEADCLELGWSDD